MTTKSQLLAGKVMDKDSNNMSENVNNISEQLLELMQFCEDKEICFDSVLNLAREMGGYPKLKSNTDATIFYQIEREDVATGEESSHSIFTTRELAENAIKNEIKAYTWEGVCPYEFRISEVRVR